MSKVVIYHNPRCSKSRATLAILEQQQADVSVIKYLENPPTESQIKTLLNELQATVRDILRTTEADYKQQGFADTSLSDTELISKLSQFPKVMQRPIISYNGHAVVGRPPENVLSLFND
jgi:arsenate reductase